MEINYNHMFVYYKGDEVVRSVKCTEKETLEAGEIMLNDFGADRVIKIEV